MGPLRIKKLFFRVASIRKHHARKKNFIVISHRKKIYYVHIRLWRPYWISIKKGGHIVFEIERYSKSFSNMIIYTCAKRHTSVTKTAYGFTLPSHYMLVRNIKDSVSSLRGTLHIFCNSVFTLLKTARLKFESCTIILKYFEKKYTCLI